MNWKRFGGLCGPILLATVLLDAALGLSTDGSDDSALADRERLAVQHFRAGWEALDFGRWSKAALYFSAALQRNPREDSVRPLDPGHSPHYRVPYLPHFFFGEALFEIGRFEDALAEWTLSAGQEEGALLAPIARRQRARLRELVLRFRRHELPAAIARVATAAEGALRLTRVAETATRGLDAEDQERLQTTFASALKRIGMLAEAVETLATRIDRGDPPAAHQVGELLADFRRNVALLGVLARTEEALESEIGGLVDALTLVRTLLLPATLGGELRPAPSRRNNRSIRIASLRRTPSPASIDPLRTDEEAWSEFAEAKRIVDSQVCSRDAIRLLESAKRRPEGGRPFAIAGLAWTPNLYLLKGHKNCNRKDAARQVLALAQQEAKTIELRELAEWVTAPDPWYRGRSRALVVGSWTYDHWTSLQHGVRDDFEAIRDLLRDLGFTVEPLPNPTVGQLKDKLAWMKKQVRPEDRFFFYYAGHGYTAKTPKRAAQEGFFIGVDAPPPPAATSASESEEEADKRATDYGIQLIDDEHGLPMADFEHWARNHITAHHSMFIVDSCFSGSLFNRLHTDYDHHGGIKSAPSYLERALANPATLFMTSGTADERTPAHSPFRAALVSVLAGEGDDEPLGYVFGSELAGWLMRQGTTKRQTPLAGMVEGPGAGDLVFKVPGGRITEEDRPTWMAPQSDPDYIEAIGDAKVWRRYHSRGQYKDYLEDPAPPFDILAREFLRRRGDPSSRAAGVGS